MSIKFGRGATEERKKAAELYPTNSNIPFDTIIKSNQLNINNTYLETLQQTYFIELIFDNEDDFKDSKNSVKRICLFEYPALDQDFTWVELIGQGSQASVELYKKKQI